MTDLNRLSDSPWPCGFGCLGLCCSRCLLGPCRLSPFDPDARGICGLTADTIVAENLLGLTAADAANGLQRLRQAVKKAEESLSRPGSDELPITDSAKRIIRRIGSSRSSRTETMAALIEASRQLLTSPQSDMGDDLLKMYVRETWRPHFQKTGSARDSGTIGLIQALAPPVPDSHDPRARLEKCMDLAAFELLTRVLAADLACLMHPDEEPEREASLHTPEIPGEDPKGMKLLVYRDGADGAGPANTVLARFQESLDPEVHQSPVSDIARLTGIDRERRENGRGELKDVYPLLVVFSRHPTPSLQGLLLGLNVLSRPVLPIHGGDAVERFFECNLIEITGGRYLMSTELELTATVKDVLRRNH